MQSSAEASIDCKANKRRGQHYWSPIGRRFLSPAVFLRLILEIKPKVVCQVLDGSDNNGRTLVKTAKKVGAVAL